ncbi:MAG TPA: histidinol-phosphate transaminase [Acidimicrobiales bacterium]|nr:histidinol-phosphate transaminase [Acidimicrobiales bacterium]
MSPPGSLPPLRPDLQLAGGYHSPQVSAEVRLNTNESPFPPPSAFVKELEDELSRVEFNRYPDRGATELRTALASLHGVRPDEIFCANGSNEVLQCLLLAYGGPGRRALLFEPTYALHGHISRLTGTELVSGSRDPDFRVDPEEAYRLQAEARPTVTFVCSPNNPTGLSEPPELVRGLLDRSEGLVVVDEAYGQFSSWGALELRDPAAAVGAPSRPAGPVAEPQPGARSLVVVRTFSKTWSMAAVRLGYAIADPEVVAACEQVVLPYHLSVPTQIAGTVALRFADEMSERVALIEHERERLADGLGELPVDSWPSDANFILFRPRDKPASAVWAGLLDRSVLVRDCSTWSSLAGCLRVTVGTGEENDRFLTALRGCLR